jgi:hypothetical protein
MVPSASAPAAPSPPAGVPPQLGGVPPQLGGGGAQSHGRPSAAGRRAGSSASLDDLAGYAGLLQRIFIGLLMAWTLLVALGVGRL